MKEEYLMKALGLAQEGRDKLTVVLGLIETCIDNEKYEQALDFFNQYILPARANLYSNTLLDKLISLSEKIILNNYIKQNGQSLMLSVLIYDYSLRMIDELYFLEENRERRIELISLNISIYRNLVYSYSLTSDLYDLALKAVSESQFRDIIYSICKDKHYPKSNFSIEDVQSNIKDDTLIIQLYITKNSIYVFHIEKNKTTLNKTHNENAILSIYQLAEKLIVLTEKNKEKGDLYQFINQIHSCIPFCLNTISKYSKLTIIPHSILNFIPMHLFFENHIVTYLPNLLFYTYQYTKIYKKREEMKSLVFSPDKHLFSKYDEYFFKHILSPDLKAFYSEDEVFDNLDRISNHYDIFIYSGHAASRYRKKNLESPHFSLGTKKRTYIDLLNVNSSKGTIAFLAACETGKVNYNYLISDEQISLSSAMFFLGYSFTISTLWEVGDLLTFILYVLFFDNYKKKIILSKFFML